MRVLVILLFCLFWVPAWGQDTATVDAASEEISANLDLTAVGTVFMESNDLEDFEKKLNDPELQVSNLDLNEDGKVDYLRVVEAVDENTHVVLIQAVIDKDQYQDVATIDVEKDEKGETTVQIVGNSYIYGPSYIVQPVYVHPPLIFSIFFIPHYVIWHSPWYWGFYPPYYHPWHPFPHHTYRRNINANININVNKWERKDVRISKRADKLDNKLGRSDFAKKYPDKVFLKRHKDLKNSTDLKRSVPKVKPEATGVKRRPPTRHRNGRFRR